MIFRSDIFLPFELRLLQKLSRLEGDKFKQGGDIENVNGAEEHVMKGKKRMS